MIRLLTIIGARPQIIKAAAISRAIKNSFQENIEEKILHTGQHYDENMSAVFFSELGIPSPDYNLHIGSESHGVQTANMIIGVEKVLSENHFDGVILYGDTNSTLAGAVAASKLNIPIFHIEAGLRSFNRTMPEEINRIVCDHLSNLLFSPTKAGIENLLKEGFDTESPVFYNHKPRQYYLTGDIMYDNSLYFSKMADANCSIIKDNHLEAEKFILCTIHRNNNTDDSSRLTSIFQALLEISNYQKVVLPLHPRTQKMMQVNLSDELYQLVLSNSNIILMPPVSFLEMIELEKSSSLIITDSGGVQKEAYYFKKPCVILRSETEWVEIVNQGAALLASADKDRIISSYHSLSQKKIEFAPIFGNGHASEFILERILDYYK